jgi:hypothetical protein
VNECARSSGVGPAGDADERALLQSLPRYDASLGSHPRCAQEYVLSAKASGFWKTFFPSFRRALVNLLKNSIYRNDHSPDFILRKSLLIQIKRILYLFIYRAVTGENYSWTDS